MRGVPSSNVGRYPSRSQRDVIEELAAIEAKHRRDGWLLVAAIVVVSVAAAVWVATWH